MAEFSTTSTYWVKDMQMFLGNVLIINQVSDEWALVAELLLRQWHFVTLLMCFIPLFVACTFPCKSQVSFDILEMFHQGTQKELEFVEFYGFFWCTTLTTWQPGRIARPKTNEIPCNKSKQPNTDLSWCLPINLFCHGWNTRSLFVSSSQSIPLTQ